MLRTVYMCTCLQFIEIKNHLTNLIIMSTGTGTRMFQDYIAKSDHGSGWKCSICGKESAQKVNLVKHIESVHFPDMFSYECKYCDKTFNAKNSLYAHVSRTHKSQ